MNKPTAQISAFNKVYQLYYRRLRYFAVGLIKDQAQADDIVSETMIKLWDRWTDTRTDDNIKAFLYITTRNACVDYLRQKRKQLSEAKEWHYCNKADSDETLLARIIETELIHELHEEVEKLPVKAREVFKMICIQGYSHEETAKNLNISLNAVRNNKFRAFEALRIKLIQKQMLTLTFLLVTGFLIDP